MSWHADTRQLDVHTRSSRPAARVSHRTDVHVSKLPPPSTPVYRAHHLQIRKLPHAPRDGGEAM